MSDEAPAISRYLQNAFASSICLGVLHSGSNDLGDPNICAGRPAIRGTRVPVTVVVGSLAGGMTFEEVQREYDLAPEDIRAALKFVGELAEQESFHQLPAG